MGLGVWFNHQFLSSYCMYEGNEDEKLDRGNSFFHWWIPNLTRRTQREIEQGSPTPGLWTCTGPRRVRNRAAQQEVISGRASEASSASPHRSPRLALWPEPSPPTAIPPVEKLSSTKPVPGAKRVGGRWNRKQTTNPRSSRTRINDLRLNELMKNIFVTIHFEYCWYHFMVYLPRI